MFGNLFNQKNSGDQSNQQNGEFSLTGNQPSVAAQTPGAYPNGQGVVSQGGYGAPTIPVQNPAYAVPVNPTFMPGTNSSPEAGQPPVVGSSPVPSPIPQQPNTTTTTTTVEPVVPVATYTVGPPGLNVSLQVPQTSAPVEMAQTTVTTTSNDGSSIPVPFDQNQTTAIVPPPVSNQNPPVAQTSGATPVPPTSTGNDEGSTQDLQKKQSISAMSRLDPRMTQVLHQASEETKRVHQALIEPEQLLFGLIYDGEIFKLLEQFSLDAAKTAKEIQAREQTGTFNGEPTLSEASQKALDDAYTNTKNRGASFITPEDVLVAIFSSATTADFLKTQGLEKGEVEQKLSRTTGYTTSRVTTLDKFGVDLTEEAKEGMLDPVTGRDKETERLIHILLRRTKNNPIIIGEPGVGKTAIVENLAQQIVSGNVPEELKNRKIIQLDIASLIAGASHRGEFEERLRGVIKEVQAADGQIILFIDEIHTLVGAGDTEGALDASNIIKPFLARGQIQMIGTTTTTEYRKYFQKDKAFERRFQSIVADEPDEDTAIKMMDVIKPKYEKFHNIVYLPEAVEGAVHLSKKYIGERYLPDKAVDLLDEAAAEVKLEVTGGQRKDNQINKSDIERVVSSWTGIPITRLTEDESEKLLHLEDLIHKRLIDQQEAVSAVAEAVRRGRIGLASANRPIASFIFLGPTGVGKTELAKTLAEIMFGRDDAMIRLDMSEYMEKHEVAKLIGAPPGYVGYEEGGQLTEAVRAKPYSIVLLDEVEKAHPDVFNILLQLLEDGRLTDNKGNTVSFRNTIVIATSNLGSSLIQKYLLENTMGKDVNGNLFNDGEKKNLSTPSADASGAMSANISTPEKKETVPGQVAVNTDNSTSSTPVTDSAQNEQSQNLQDVAKNASTSLDPSASDDKNINDDQTTPGDTKENQNMKPKKIDFEELNKILLEELHKFFRPELINRFDELVVFKPLSEDDMSSIAELNVKKTSKLLQEQGFNVQITDSALAVLAKEGYDPVYGARPLRRLIQTSIENPIALQIIGKQYVAGDIILIDYDEGAGKFVFSKATPPETANGTSDGTSGEPAVPQPPDGQSAASVVPGENSLSTDPSVATPTPDSTSDVGSNTTPSQDFGLTGQPTPAAVYTPPPPAQEAYLQSQIVNQTTGQVPTSASENGSSTGIIQPDSGNISSVTNGAYTTPPSPDAAGNGMAQANGGEYAQTNGTYSATVN